MKSIVLLVGVVGLAGLRAQASATTQGGDAQRLDLEPLQLRLADPGASGSERVFAAAVQRAVVRDGVLDLRDLRAHVTFGPDPALAASADRPLALTLELRTKRAEFGTVLMCRDGGVVHYSFTTGRQPGRMAFEPWSWTRDKLLSRRRLDDGAWHVLEAAFDPASGMAGLRVDGTVDAVQSLHGGFAGGGNPALRLGHNLDPGVDQPFGGEVRRFERRSVVPAWLLEATAWERACRVLDRRDNERALSAWLDHARRPRPPDADSAADWSAQVVTLRARVQDALGLWPPPYAAENGRLDGHPSPLSWPVGTPGVGGVVLAATDFTQFVPTLPLDVREGGTLERARHTVTRVYWQTFAGYFASGYLYRPRPQPAGRGPAMLCPHGHWENGARHPVVQARCIGLAQQGYVVLTVDSIHLYDDRIGLSPLSVMTWNNLRGLELLRGRADVDPARIGCTGASGGGQQTYYLTALDCGLAAAAPAVMACHFEDILSETGVHCACNHTPHLLRAADMPQMAAAFAPRPQFFLTVTGDWTAHFQEHGYPEVAGVYRLFGAEGSVRCQRWNKGHAYDQEMREAAYAFFAEALGVPGGADFHEPPGGVATEDPATLATLDRPEVPRDPQAIVAEFHARLEAPRGAEGVGRLRALLEHDEEPVQGSPLSMGSAPTPHGDIERWSVPTDGDLRLPALVLRADRTESGDRVALLLADGAGKAAAFQRHAELIGALRAVGVSVVVADVRYVGELDLGQAWRDLYGRFFGLDEGVLAVRDARRLVAALPAMGFESPRVALVGLGDRGAVALLAGLLDGGVRVAAAPEPGPTYRQVARTPALARVLLHADLDDVLVALGRRALVGDAVAVRGLVEALAR